MHRFVLMKLIPCLLFYGWTGPEDLGNTLKFVSLILGENHDFFADIIIKYNQPLFDALTSFYASAISLCRYC